ncbi:hypothetical protein F5Y16DRAFT_376780 [Xylariaceae sp. FL0255]|nr:hypothetical protein F5Y16DRAFT_376780 [Xylariaceae sp. FL0255]
MTFGSLKPTSKSQTLLQLQWDCSGKGGATRKLVDLWVEEASKAGSQVLNEKEHRAVAGILGEQVSSVTKTVGGLLQKEPVHFIRVRNQLLSLLVAWEQIMLEKKRYDEEGLHPSENMDDLSPHQFLILFQTVWGRAQVGLTDLTPSPAIKRSIESDSPPPTKRARCDSEEQAGVSEEASGQKRRAEQGDDESSTKRAKVSE